MNIFLSNVFFQICTISLSKLEKIVILMIKITQVAIGGIHFYNAFEHYGSNVLLVFIIMIVHKNYLFSFVEEHECITNIIHIKNAIIFFESTT
jgi:hypothetical protein